MDSVKAWRNRRLKRLRTRGIRMDAPDDSESPNVGNNHFGGSRKGKSENHGNTHLPYGIAKSRGLDTTDKTPKEVWDMLKGELGVDPKEAYEKLGKGERVDVPPARKTTVIHGGREYRELYLDKHVYSSRDTVWTIFGYYDREYYDLTKTKMRGLIERFTTKEDALYWLREHDVGEIAGGHGLPEKIDAFKEELPEYIGSIEGKKIKSLSLAKSGDTYSLKAEYLDGSKHKIKEGKTLSALKNYVKSYTDIPYDKVKVSKSAIKADRERNEWSRTGDGTYYEDTETGKKIGKLSLAWSKLGDGYYVVGEDADGVRNTKSFDSKAKAIEFLKSKGVRRATLFGEEIDPETYEEPKTVATVDGKDYIKLEMEKEWYGYALVGHDHNGEKELISSKRSYMSMFAFKEELAKKGLSLDDSRITMSDDIRSDIEREEAEEYEETKRLEEEKKRKEEFDRKEKEALSNPSYFLWSEDGHVYSDFRLVADEDMWGEKRWTLYGKDVEGNRKKLDYTYVVPDSLEDKLDDLGADYEKGTYEKSVGTYEDAGIKHLISKAFIRSAEGGKFRVTLKDETGKKLHPEKRFESEKEAAKFIEDIGCGSYTNTSGDTIEIEGKFVAMPKPAFRMRKISIEKVGDSFKVYADVKEGKTFTSRKEMFTGTKEECKKWASDNGADMDSVSYRVPVPNSDAPHTYKAKSLQKFDEHKAETVENSYLSKIDENDRQLFTDAITEVFNNCGVYRTARGYSHFLDMVEQGYKSQVETGTGGDGAFLGVSKRREASAGLFGRSKKDDKTEFEKYGYFGPDDDSRALDRYHPDYGELDIVFDTEKLGDDVTYTMGDSLGSSRDIGHCAGRAGKNPTMEGATYLSKRELNNIIVHYKNYKNGNITKEDLLWKVVREAGSYIECQFHGDIQVDKMKRVVFEKDYYFTRAFGYDKERRIAALKKLKDNGVELKVKDRGVYIDGYEYYKREYPDDILPF